MNLEQDGENIVRKIKEATWFPYKNGNLRDNATDGHLVNDSTYVITFDSTIAPYVECLEEGTDPHNIPRAFGRPLPFGTSGRFNGKFHPGSDKHKGFIKDKSVNAVVNYFITKYKGQLRWYYLQK